MTSSEASLIMQEATANKMVPTAMAGEVQGNQQDY